MLPESDKTQKNGIGKNFTFEPVKSIEDFHNHNQLQKTQKNDYTFITFN